jgi:hypothetical protein
MYDEWEDEQWEPGADAGPERESAEGECDACGEVGELGDDALCVECADDAVFGDADDAAYAAAPGWRRCSWGWCEDFGADL